MPAEGTTTKERPIIFGAESVRAILEGRKTQTRRVVDFRRATCASDCRGPKPDEAWIDPGGTVFGPGPYLKVPCDDGAAQRVHCPYGYPQDGATLWVRETWQPFFKDGAIYLADAGTHDLNATSVADAKTKWPRWRRSIHMPRWASRISLRVLTVSVDRLQAIKPSDARAEGDFGELSGSLEYHEHGERCYVNRFASLWDSINGKRAPWSSDPWVWCIEFERVTTPEVSRVG